MLDFRFTRLPIIYLQSKDGRYTPKSAGLIKIKFSQVNMSKKIKNFLIYMEKQPLNITCESILNCTCRCLV